jgi:hypothetical protein
VSDGRRSATAMRCGVHGVRLHLRPTKKGKPVYLTTFLPVVLFIN